MPAGLTRSPASSPAFRGLLASPWKARLPYQLRLSNAKSSQSTYATIAEAMLKKAVSAHPAPPPPSKNDLAKTLFPSSSPAQDGNIEEQFKKARQSIGGFAGVSNRVNPSNPLRGSSANVKLPFKRSDTFSSTNTASNSSINSSHRASTSSTYRPSTSGLSSVLNKPDAFQNTPDTVLSQKTPPSSKVVHAVVEFDENDFDDDDDIDLDMDYELPSTKSMQPPPKPARRPDISEFAYNSKPPPEQTSPQLPQRTVNTKPTSHNPTSSAQTWSSSPQSHYKSPPGAVLRRQRESSTQASTIDLTQDNDINPRPAKRRTLPWMQEEAEEAEILEKKEEKEIKAARATSRASPTGNRRISKFKREESTPAPKEKHMPWNTTASAIKDQQRLFKEKQSKAKKDAVTPGQAMTSHSSRRAAPIQLSDEQTRVLELVVNQGKSVFFTGSAGTGKSVLMRAIIDKLRKKFMREPDRVAVTASTGLAACNIGGVTLHSFGGIGLGKEDVATLVKKIKRNAKAKNRWLRTKILIVDEISMVDGDLFDKLEGIARAMRNNGRPFGGIQLVITGDFFQLPPVPDHDKKDRAVKFAFDAGTWGTSIHHTIGLTEVFRQKDPVFANMLNEMRLGNISNDTIQAFKKLSRPINYEDSLDATELFPTRYEVENSNAVRMRGLHGKSYVFPAKDGGAIKDEKMLDKLLSNMMAPKTIELKKGAQVMLIKNMDEMLVNGSLGKVTAFMSEKSFEIFANTYNDNPDIFDSNVPDETLDDESLEQRQRFNNLKARDRLDTGTLYPLVEFAIADGTRRSILVQPEEWKVELPNGEIQAQRSQLPLILAWALSIHKAQGQTLERVKIDLKKIFEKGQAYVALSRATSQAGLEVKNFDKSKVMAHPRVGQFYSSLYSVNKALEHPKVAAPAVPAPKTTKVEEPSMSNMVQPHGTVFDDDEEEAMAAFG